MFQLSAQPGHGPRITWAPVDYGAAGDTLRQGQLVQSTGDGVAPLGAASGAYDATGKKVAVGLVMGTSNLDPVFDETYSAEYITSVATQAAQLARNCGMTEGFISKNDKRAMVAVAWLTPETVLKGRLFKSTFGTLPVTVATTAAASDGASGTFLAETMNATPLADQSVCHFRDGLNAGLQRNISAFNDTTDVATFPVNFMYGIGSGDNAVIVNLREFGLSRCQFDAESCFVDVGAALSADYYGINVIGLDLRNAGEETVLFTLNPTHLSAR